MKIFLSSILLILVYSCQKTEVNAVTNLRTMNVFGQPISTPLLKVKDIYVNNEDTGYHFFYENDLLVRIIKGENNDTTKMYRFFYNSQEQLTGVSIKYNGFALDMEMDYDALGRVIRMRETSFYNQEYTYSYPASDKIVIDGYISSSISKDTLIFDNEHRLIESRNYRTDTFVYNTVALYVNYTYSPLSHFAAGSPVQDLMMLLIPVQSNFVPFEWPFVGGKNLISSSTAGFVNFPSGTTTLTGINQANNYPTYADYVRGNIYSPWAVSLEITYY